jgi:predicted DNA-binding transcriptional regulator AlpA
MQLIELAGRTYERADALKARLGVCEATLWRLVVEGMPKPVKIGRWRFYPRTDIDEWFAHRAE